MISTNGGCKKAHAAWSLTGQARQPQHGGQALRWVPPGKALRLRLQPHDSYQKAFSPLQTRPLLTQGS